jgi:hypothetical protein
MLLSDREKIKIEGANKSEEVINDCSVVIRCLFKPRANTEQ